MPVVVEVEEQHLRFSGFQDAVTEFLDLQASLEWQLKLAALDDDIREIEQVTFKRVKHALSSHDNLLRLLLDGQASDECCHFFSCLPLSQLPKSLLASPNAGMDNLEE